MTLQGDSSKTTWIRNKLRSLSLEQKIGATLTAQWKGSVFLPLVQDLIETCHIGGLRVTPNSRANERHLTCRGDDGFYVIAGKNQAPKAYTLDRLRHMYRKLQELALARPCATPLHMAFDQEGEFSGDLRNGGTPVFPPPMGLAASGDPKLAYEVALALSRIARSACVNMIHSPVLDVNTEPRNPEINTRAYSDRAEVVVEYALQSARGFKEGRLIATAKHFPGRGHSFQDAHDAIPVIHSDFDTLWNVHLLPYRALIEKNLLPAIMTAHTVYPAVDPDNVATLSAKWLQDMLREKMGFEGVITTDAIGMGGITLKYDVALGTAMALAAGADMVLIRPSSGPSLIPRIPEIIAKVREFIESGKLQESDLDRKVERILTMKYDIGLFDNAAWSEDVNDVLTDKRVIEAAEKPALKSVFVLRQEPGVFPLSRGQRALVIEQTFNHPLIASNDDIWPPGMLYDSLMRYSRRLSYFEISSSCEDAAHEDQIVSLAGKFDTVIVTNWTRRSAASVIGLVRKLATSTIKKVILVTNTPYEAFSVPPEARNVIVHFGLTRKGIDTVADVLFGAPAPGVKWPLQYRP